MVDLGSHTVHLLVVQEVLRGYGGPPLIVAGWGIREGAILRLARTGTLPPTPVRAAAE